MMFPNPQMPMFPPMAPQPVAQIDPKIIQMMKDFEVHYKEIMEFQKEC